MKPEADRYSAFNVVHSTPNGEASGISTEELQSELEKRQLANVFPFEVFHESARDYMKLLHEHMNIPRAFIGLSMLTAYSSAIGTRYAVKRGRRNTYMSMWSCMEGMTSSGKTLPYEIIFEPLKELQTELDKENKQEKEFTDPDAYDPYADRMREVIIRDVQVPTLVRTVLPDNPKGVTKTVDEILEWINGMNPNSRSEGTDEQFWLSGWNGTEYRLIRANRFKAVVPRVFVNVIGGIQPTITWKLFLKDRDTTGFIFRILFATAEEHRIALPDDEWHMPEHHNDMHKRVLQTLFNELPVDDEYEEPWEVQPELEAIRLHKKWRYDKATTINAMDELNKKEIHAGILGKISEYAYRFAGLLAVTDMVYDEKKPHYQVYLTKDHMSRAIQLAEYFYESAWQVYGRVKQDIVVPMEVLRWAGYMRGNWSMEKIGVMEYPNLKPDSARKKAGRQMRKYIEKYPRAFNAQAKS